MQSRRGYTLLELVLVGALMVIIAALSYPSIDSMYSYYKVQAATDAVRAAWANARIHAMEEGRAYRFSVIPGKGNYRVAPDSAEFWSGSTPEHDPNNPFLVCEEALPSKVHFALQGVGSDGPEGDNEEPGKVDAAQYITVAIFNPDGTAQDDCEITFHHGSTRGMTLSLRSITGMGTVKPANPEGGRP
jgi:type II secretory pathway pseudopilin PulG